MAQLPTFELHPSTYPSPTISPTLSLPSLSGSYLLDSDEPTPGTPNLDSTTGFEPLTSSPPQSNSLKLTMSPGLHTEGWEGHEQKQEQGSEAETTATIGMLYQEDPERESTSNPDEVEQVVTDPYETAFMELRILRLSSRRLFNAVLKLSRSEQLGQRTRSADLDDQMAIRIFDIHTNLEATTNAMSRLYVMAGYKSNRFRRAEPLGRTRNRGLQSVVTGQLDDKGGPSETNSSQGEGTEPWDSDSPTLANASVDALAVSALPNAVVKNQNAAINNANYDSWLRRVPHHQWRVCLEDLGGAPFQHQLSMVILFIVVELFMQAVGWAYRVWATSEIWSPRDVKYQCWEVV